MLPTQVARFRRERQHRRTVCDYTPLPPNLAPSLSGGAWSNITSTLSDLATTLATLLLAYERVVDTPHQRAYWDPSASPPFASTSQSARNLPSLVISGPMSYNSAMHGSFNAYPPFSQQHQPLLGTGYNANTLQQTMSGTCVDLSAQTAQQIAALQAKLNKKLGPG